MSVLGFLSQLFWCEERQEVKLLGECAWQLLGNKEKVWSSQLLHPCSPLTPPRLSTFSIVSTSTLGSWLFLSLRQNAWCRWFQRARFNCCGLWFEAASCHVPKGRDGRSIWHLLTLDRNREVERILLFIPPSLLFSCRSESMGPFQQQPCVVVLHHLTLAGVSLLSHTQRCVSQTVLNPEKLVAKIDGCPSFLNFFCEGHTVF